MLDFDSAELINAVINIENSEINNFKNYLDNKVHEKPIQLIKSKINLSNKENLLLSANIKKLRISGKGLFSKLVSALAGTCSNQSDLIMFSAKG